jgi:hypothetical protein
MSRIKNIIVRIEGQEPFNIDVLREMTYSAINDFKLKHPEYSYFQYDSVKHDFWGDDAQAKSRWLRGYLIRKGLKLGDARSQIVECEMKLQ